MKWGDCRKNLPMMLNFSFGNGSIDRIEILPSYINVTTDEISDLEMTMEVFKCTLDMKECDRYPTPPVVENLCEKFEHKNTFYSGIFEGTNPRLKCPLKIGIYNFKKIEFEIPSVFMIFPLDGKVWVTTFKLVDRKSRKLMACLNSETKILRKRVRD
jgi:hypothetical protein